MTDNMQKIFQSLEEDGIIAERAEKLKMSWCDTCDDYTEDNLHDYSKGCTGHPDTWEAPDVICYCDDCGDEK